MCGIFGLVLKSNSQNASKEFERVENLIQLSESRGKEASGILVASNHSIIESKTKLKASIFIKQNEWQDIKQRYLKDPAAKTVFVGHARLETNGTRNDDKNNMPISRDNLIGVHNGIITNIENLWSNHPELSREAIVDSEFIFEYFNYHLDKGKSYEDITTDFYNKIQGSATIAIVDRKTNDILIATNTGSLFILDEDNYFTFASERRIPEQSKEMNLIDRFFGTFKYSNNVKQIRPGQFLIYKQSTGKHLIQNFN